MQVNEYTNEWYFLILITEMTLAESRVVLHTANGHVMDNCPFQHASCATEVDLHTGPCWGEQTSRAHTNNNN